MAIEQITPKEAWERSQNDPSAIIIDVRSIPEFSDGHPKGSLNIPILHIDAASGSHSPNIDFQTVVEKHIPKDKTVLLSCRSGQRSMMAAMQMEHMGYEKLFNVKGGFSGSDTTPGWQSEHLPCEKGQPAGQNYDELLKAAS